MPLINAGFNRVRNGVYDFILLQPVSIYNIVFIYIFTCRLKPLCLGLSAFLTYKLCAV